MKKGYKKNHADLSGSETGVVTSIPLIQKLLSIIFAELMLLPVDQVNLTTSCPI